MRSKHFVKLGSLMRDGHSAYGLSVELEHVVYLTLYVLLHTYSYITTLGFFPSKPSILALANHWS